MIDPGVLAAQDQARAAWAAVPATWDAAHAAWTGAVFNALVVVAAFGVVPFSRWLQARQVSDDRASDQLFLFLTIDNITNRMRNWADDINKSSENSVLCNQYIWYMEGNEKIFSTYSSTRYLTPGMLIAAHLFGQRCRDTVMHFRSGQPGPSIRTSKSRAASVFASFFDGMDEIEAELALVFSHFASTPSGKRVEKKATKFGAQKRMIKNQLERIRSKVPKEPS